MLANFNGLQGPYLTSSQLESKTSPRGLKGLNFESLSRKKVIFLKNPSQSDRQNVCNSFKIPNTNILSG